MQLVLMVTQVATIKILRKPPHQQLCLHTQVFYLHQGGFVNIVFVTLLIGLGSNFRIFCIIDSRMLSDQLLTDSQILGLHKWCEK